MRTYTEEEIEKQAEEYKNKLAREHYAYYLLDFAKMCFQDGAKWMQKKLKCCGNCKHERCGSICISPEKCVDMNKWEVKE